MVQGFKLSLIYGYDIKGNKSNFFPSRHGCKYFKLPGSYTGKSTKYLLSVAYFI